MKKKAQNAIYVIKTMPSEKSLRIASTGKDPKSGRLLTQEYKVDGPVQIILTTTEIEINEELQNRCLILTINESQEQTEKIHQLQRERETLEGMLSREDRNSIMQKHQNAQRLLENLRVINPLAKDLTFLNHRLRNRRDHAKYLTLIRSIILLHQHQREIKTKKHRGKSIRYVEVKQSDIEIANKLFNEILGHSLDELAP